MRILTVFVMFILLLGGVGWWLTHIDWERYRPELAAQISDSLGATVRLNGPLSISFFPYPKLSAERAELTASGLRIEAPHLRLTAKLWPLLRGHVILSSADIQDPKIAIDSALWQPPRAPQDIISRTKIQLQDVEIKNGELDVAFGQDHEVMTEIDLQLRAPDWHGPYQADADFMWHGQEWELASELGIKTAAGTRPANFTLKQSDGPHQFTWHGAINTVPMMMRGDGEWHSATDNLTVKAEVDWIDQMIEVSRGVLSAHNKTLGAVAGHFMVGKNIWQSLDADLAGVSPGWLAGLDLMHLDPAWHQFNGAGQLQFHLQNGALANLEFRAPELTALYQHLHWHIWGGRAVDALALWFNADIHAWPATLAQPFDLRLTETNGNAQIENLQLGKTQAHGSLKNQNLDLEIEAMGWPAGDSIDAWRNVLREFGLQKFTLSARRWELLPFSIGNSKMTLIFGKDADHLAFTTPNLNVTGVFQDDDFNGMLACSENHAFQVFRAGCGAAKITGDDHQWQFQNTAETNQKSAPHWQGEIDFAAAAWNLHLPFSHGEISANGKLAQADYHMNITNVDLSEFMQIFLPNAPKGEGDLNGQLHVTPEKAEGDLTASNLQLSGLNLLLDNPAQPGKIGMLTGKVNWQGGVLELQQLRTTTPDGTGHASVNLDSGIWHGDWADARSNHVTIDGAVDAAAVQRYHFTDAPRSELRWQAP